MSDDQEKTIYLVRHGQGYHQGEPSDECENIRDAGKQNRSLHPRPLLIGVELNEAGIAQCRRLCAEFPFHDKVDLILASPLRRAIQTALYGYAPEIDRGLKVLLMPLAQEVSDKPMDVGSDQATLEKQFGDKLDYSRLYEGWHDKEGLNDTDTESIKDRGKRLRQYLKSRKEKNIVVVFHGSFVHYLTGNLQHGEKIGDAWQNASWRMYNFEDVSDEDPVLLQKAESKARALPGQAAARDDVGE